MLAKSVSLFATDVTSKWRRTGKCAASRSVSELLSLGPAVSTWVWLLGSVMGEPL